MANGPDLAIWEQRWLAADGAMDKLAKSFGDPQLASDWEVTLQSVIRRLQDFAKGLFYLFYDTYDKSSYKLERHILEPELPADFVLYAILRQVADDLEVIQRAAGQRSLPLGGQLTDADILAWEALQPLISRLDSGTTALTYFQKSPDVRVIPYAPVALIGIELSAGHPDPDAQGVRHVPRDFLAIPHEVGHYVFWRGETANGQRIHDSFRGGDVPQDLAWCESWIEEIFADVHGCWLGGAVMALAAQEMQRAYPRDRFTADDGEHPVPVLRPYIYTKVLDNLLDSLAGELHGDWTTFLSNRPDSDQFTIDEGGNVSVGEAISPGLAIDSTRPVDAVIEASLQCLQGLSTSENRWRDYLASAPGKDALYGEFEDSTLFAASGSPPSFSPNDTSPFWDTWVDQRVDHVDPDYDSSALHQGAGVAGQETEIPSAVWKAILFAEGWTTRYATSWKR